MPQTMLPPWCSDAILWLVHPKLELVQLNLAHVQEGEIAQAP